MSRTAERPSPPPDDRFIVNAYVDGFFLGFASLLCFLWFRYAVPGYSTLQIHESAIFLATTLAWIGSWPHFSATAWRLYESRENIRAYPLTAWLAPVLVMLAALGCFLYPVSFAPYFIKLFLLWSPWHFSLQTFGLLMLYSRRSNIPVPPLAKKALAGFFISSFLVQYSESEISLRTAFMYAITYPQLDLPALTPLFFKAVMVLCLAASVIGWLPSLRAARPFPYFLALPLATQYLWFVHGTRDLSFQLLLPLFHGIQYLLIAWGLEVRTKAAKESRPSFRSSLFTSARWMGANFAIGALLFAGLPWLLSKAGIDLAFATLVILASVSVHHYFVDGVIWKLQRERANSPLFGNVSRAWRKT